MNAVDLPAFNHLTRTFPFVSVPGRLDGLPVEVCLVAQLTPGSGDKMFYGVLARQREHLEFVNELDEPSAKLHGTNFVKGDATAVYSLGLDLRDILFTAMPDTGYLRPEADICFHFERNNMPIKRMDNVLIVVDDLESVKTFFIELGLKLEGETTVEGPDIGSLIGLKDVRATLAMLRTPDGQGIELDKFHSPEPIRNGRSDVPMNTLGFCRVMFAVDDIDDIVAHMLECGADIIGQMQYESTYKLAYIRGPEGIVVALAEQLG